MKEEIIRHLKKFVSFRTISGAREEKVKCLHWIEETFNLQHSTVHPLRGEVEDAPYLYLPHPNPKLLFFAHIDVVPGHDAQFSLQQEGAHAAYPWDSVNPNFLLADALKKIQTAFPTGTKDDWQMTVTPTKLSGSVARNQIPEISTAGLDIRFPPQLCKNPDEAKALVEKHLPKGCLLETVLAADPLGTDPNHPMVQMVKKIAEEVTGETVLFEREHGGTDARYFGTSGIPSFLYGPVGEGLHGADEWVSLKSLMQQYDIGSTLLTELSQ